MFQLSGLWRLVVDPQFGEFGRAKLVGASSKQQVQVWRFFEWCQTCQKRLTSDTGTRCAEKVKTLYIRPTLSLMWLGELGWQAAQDVFEKSWDVQLDVERMSFRLEIFKQVLISWWFWNERSGLSIMFTFRFDASFLRTGPRQRLKNHIWDKSNFG